MSTSAQRNSRRAKEPGPAADGCFIIGARGVIEDVDELGCALLGYAREEMVGLHGSEIVPVEARPATAATLDRMRLGEFARSEGRLTHKDGTILRVEVTARRLPDRRLFLSLRRNG